MKRVYCITGLGGNQRLFERLHVDGYQFVPVPWIPFERDDTLPGYAAKLAKTIPETNPLILGLSFGGMLATEIAKVIPVRKAIIVSSAKGRQELNLPGGALARWLINAQVVPHWYFTQPKIVALWYLGARDPEDKKMLREIIRTSDGRFMKWALKAIVNWGSDAAQNVVHIHGTADKVIRPRGIKADYWLENGTHFMIYNRAGEVSSILSQILAQC